MWKKALSAVAVALGLAVAAFILRPTIAGTAASSGSQQWDDGRIPTGRVSDRVAVYALKMAVDDPSLVEPGGTVTNRTSDYAGNSTTDDRGRSWVDARERSEATLYAMKVGMDDSLQLAPSISSLSLDDRGQILRGGQTERKASAYAAKFAVVDRVESALSTSLLALDTREQAQSGAAGESRAVAYAAKVAVDD